MARIRLKMLPLNLLTLISLMALGASASSPAAGDSTPSPSPSAEIELICHTDNPAECYPKVFQATDEFQVVHEDQDLPKGLHVRLDVNTGRREAKINIPDEDNPALAGLPVDSSVVVVERDIEEDQQPKIPADAPAYDPIGKIKEPSPANSDESSAFYRSLTILKKGLDVDGALEMLEDISHDIYYGLKIAEDYHTVQELFCLASAPSGSGPSTRARLAALTLASTVQNNPKALASITTHWAQLSTFTCPSENNNKATHTIAQTTFRPSLSTSSSETTDDPTLLKARLSLLSGLLKSPTIRTAFLSASGPSHLLPLLTSPTLLSSPDWEGAQRKAALLLLDNFLDGDMGAALGEWPTQVQATEKECAAANEEEGDGEKCWDWRVARVADQYRKDKGHWSHELKGKVVEQRKANLGKSRGGKQEL